MAKISRRITVHILIIDSQRTELVEQVLKAHHFVLHIHRPNLLTDVVKIK